MQVCCAKVMNDFELALSLKDNVQMYLFIRMIQNMT
jgi:hypothetical protein